MKMQDAALIAGWLVLGLSMSACRAPAIETATSAASETPSPSITPAASSTPTDEPVNAFSQGVSPKLNALLILEIPAIGDGPFQCASLVQVPTLVFQPIDEVARLCLYHFPVDQGSYTIDVSLTAPDGTAFRETYTLVEAEFGMKVLDARGDSAGTGSLEYPGAPPTVSITINTAANIPAGVWTVSASAEDAPGGPIRAGPVSADFTQQTPLVSAVGSAEVDPLHRPATAFSDGETIHVFGTAYQPETSVVVVFYYEDPFLPLSEAGKTLLAPMYGTTLTTDAQGNFRVEFVVSASMPRGRYMVIAEAQIGQDYKIKNPFVGRFTISD
jgi:hypothetical protein